jgi:hypothetical protein
MLKNFPEGDHKVVSTAEMEQPNTEWRSDWIRALAKPGHCVKRENVSLSRKNDWALDGLFWLGAACL